jgi:GTP cyclohydrolase IA
VPFSPTTFPNDEGYDELVVACDLQIQGRLTGQVAGWLQERLDPRGVGVVLEAEHLCMTVRGVQDPGGGRARDDPRTRAEFLALATTVR